MKESVTVLRHRVALLAATATACALALTACGPNSGGSSSSASSSSSSSSSDTSSAASGIAGALAALDFKTGTAKQNNAPANTGDFYKGSRSDPAAMKWVQLTAGSAGKLNPVVVDGAGFTLYRFDKDSAKPSKSTCDGSCATTWPPVLVKAGSKIFTDGVTESQVGVVRRDDGNLQLTIGGRPVYRYSKDTAPGQTNGQGVGGTWFGVTPTGGKAQEATSGNEATGLDYKTGTAKANNAPANTGDFYKGSRSDPAAMKWVQLSNGSADGLNPIVHDGADFTLYRFDKDSAKPSKSTCDGSCATTWPPVLVQPGTKIFADGVDASQVSVVRRDDGGLQLTIGGWPVYRYSKDTAGGQTNGEGVGGTWYAVSPTGGKVQPTVVSNSNPS